MNQQEKKRSKTTRTKNRKEKNATFSIFRIEK
jgi:hypothetical protein